MSRLWKIMTTRKATYGCNEGVIVYRQSVAATSSYLNTYVNTYLNTYKNTYLSVRHSLFVPFASVNFHDTFEIYLGQ